MLKRKWYELLVLNVLAVLTTVLFWDGHLDIEIAEMFFHFGHDDKPWPLKTYWLSRGMYELGYPSVVISAVAALLIIAVGFVYKPLTRSRYPALYFVAVIVLGPILMVNLVLKDHWGRPRPREIVEFNGDYHYQPPGVISETGRKSFVCGHCSSGYMFFAFYFILNKGKNLALLCSLLYGLLFGFARMMAGGHFLSDILWSGYVVFGICWFLYYVVFREFSFEATK